MNILFLADISHHTNAVSDHINAITKNSKHTWYIENPLTCKALHKLDFSLFDAIGFHYSIRPHKTYYCSRSLFQKVKAFQGIKFQFIQDEYYRVNNTMECMAELDLDIVFTLVRPELIRKAYPDPRLKKINFVTVLTAYVPGNLQTVVTPLIKNRTLDIFYRSRTCPFWLGELAQDKIRIAQGVRKLAQEFGLTIDLSVREEDRIYGLDWIKSLSSAKAVLGTESGASIWDFSGLAEIKARDYLRKNPGAQFEEVQKNVLHPFEGNILYSAISPRIFEAAALKTPMIMFPGWYSGLCEANVHYILLEKDFSNFQEVVNKLQDTDYLQRIAERAHNDLIASGKYTQNELAKTVDCAFESFIQEKVIIKSEVSNSISLIKSKYKLLSGCSWLLTEIKFIVRNFFRILLDRTSPPSKKIGILYSEALRYWLYLKTRFHTANTQ